MRRRSFLGAMAAAAVAPMALAQNLSVNRSNLRPNRHQVRSGLRMPWQLPWITEYWDGRIGITITGAGVSSWTPIVGTHSFTQGTDSLRPTYANGVLTFDGADDFIKTGAFTLSQPLTMIAVLQQITWTAADSFWSGVDGSNECQLSQRGTTPNLQLYAGSLVADNTNLAVGVFGFVAAVFNGAASSITVNATAATTGNAGAQNMGAITLGAASGGTQGWSNIAVKAIGYANAALTAAQIAQTYASCARRYAV